MSALLSRECDRLIAKLQADMVRQERERTQRHAELMAGFDRLDAALDDATKYAVQMVRIVPVTPADDDEPDPNAPGVPPSDDAE